MFSRGYRLAPNKIVNMENNFDQVASEWDNNQIHVKRTEAVANAILSTIEINQEMIALEFGAGTGMLSFALKDRFAEITLMDSSFQMVCVTVGKIAAQGVHNLFPMFFDLEKDEYNEKTFDVIFSQMALHHVADIDNLILKFSKLLNPGGILAIADLYKEDGTFHDKTFTGHNGFDPEQLMEKLKRQNFYKINYKKCYEMEKLSAEGTVKNFPIFLITAYK